MTEHRARLTSGAAYAGVPALPRAYARRRQQARQLEVRELRVHGLALAQQDVLRLDIAAHEPHSSRRGASRGARLPVGQQVGLDMFSLQTALVGIC